MRIPMKLFALLVLMAAGDLHAQIQKLPPYSKVRIFVGPHSDMFELELQQQTKDTLFGFDDEVRHIAVATNRICRLDISTVHAPSVGARRGAFSLGAVWMIIGAVVGGSYGAYFDMVAEFATIGGIGGGLLGAFLGAIIGSKAGAEDWETVYIADPRPKQ